MHTKLHQTCTSISSKYSTCRKPATTELRAIKPECAQLSEWYYTQASARPSGKWFHMWMVPTQHKHTSVLNPGPTNTHSPTQLGVSESARGRKIGVKLCKHAIAWAKKQKFDLCFAECTSGISTHILTKYCGQTVEHFVDYSTWSGEDCQLLRPLPALGHKGMSLTVTRLSPGPVSARSLYPFFVSE